MQDFRNLDVWALGHEFVLDVYRQTRGFPKEELFGLNSQLRRASVAPNTTAHALVRASGTQSVAVVGVPCVDIRGPSRRVAYRSVCGWVRWRRRNMYSPTPNPALKRTRRQRPSLPLLVPFVSCHRTPPRAAHRLALR